MKNELLFQVNNVYERERSLSVTTDSVPVNLGYSLRRYDMFSETLFIILHVDF